MIVETVVYTIIGVVIGYITFIYFEDSYYHNYNLINVY